MKASDIIMTSSVTDFQWHMERSQDEIMNSNDSVRENQGKLKHSAAAVTGRAARRWP